MQFIVIVSMMIIIFCNSICVSQEKGYMETFSLKRIMYDTISTSREISVEKALHKHLSLTDDYQLQQRFVDGKDLRITDDLGYTHLRYHLFYKGVRIENTDIRTRTIGNITLANGEYINIPFIDVSIVLSEEEAIKKAISHINAKKYRWESEEENNWLKELTNGERISFYPSPELVIYANSNDVKAPSFNVAYKVTIASLEPYANDDVYIDAKTGNVISAQSLISNATATTKYSGTQSIATSYDNPVAKYTLKYKEMNTVTPQYPFNFDIETRNLNNTVAFSSATPFYNTSNNWNNAWLGFSSDQQALDAHWGAEVTYNYFKEVHNRSSYDNNRGKLKVYIHSGADPCNAFWDYDLNLCHFGDGSLSCMRSAHTSLDIVAHEISHGVSKHSAQIKSNTGLVGAVKESISDIWAACIQNWANQKYKFPVMKKAWYIGDEIDNATYTVNYTKGLRCMSWPKHKDHPDCYGGQHWKNPNAAGSTHWNCEVMNFWFFLLCENSGSYRNDLGNLFTVEGVGIEAAEKIFYRAMTLHMTENTDFVVARECTIKAASEMYGFCSPEAIAVTNAWYAVGVGNAFVYPSNTINISGNFNAGTTTIKENANIINTNGATTVKSGATLILDACHKTTINPGFKVEAGAHFIVR